VHIKLGERELTDERITAYLLGELTEREAEQFEEQCFAQPEWPVGELDSAEDDLIEAYLHNELTPDRHRRFEEKYLTTAARQERVLLARSFLCVACSADPPNPSWFDQFRRSWNVQWVIPKYATLLAILILSVVLFVWSWNRPSTPRTFADINLVSFTSARGAKETANPITEKVTLPLGADALRISLTLPEPTPAGATYSVEWENVKGLLKTLPIESQDAKSIKVVIPANDLAPGQYTLKLVRKKDGEIEQRIGAYFFNVE
jgi:hypothetical protein